MSRTGCHGTCRALVSAHARGMCGESVLYWLLTKQDVLLNVNATRILKFVGFKCAGFKDVIYDK